MHRKCSPHKTSCFSLTTSVCALPKQEMRRLLPVVHLLPGAADPKMACMCVSGAQVASNHLGLCKSTGLSTVRLPFPQFLLGQNLTCKPRWELKARFPIPVGGVGDCRAPPLPPRSRAQTQGVSAAVGICLMGTHWQEMALVRSSWGNLCLNDLCLCCFLYTPAPCTHLAGWSITRVWAVWAGSLITGHSRKLQADDAGKHQGLTK